MNLKISEKSLITAEEHIVAKNIKLSDMDDRIIFLENENLEKTKIINNEVNLKDTALKELEVKNNSVMDFDYKYNIMRDEYDVHKFDVDAMTKEMREMKIKTSILT